jgi:hypothetical protein
MPGGHYVQLTAGRPAPQRLSGVEEDDDDDDDDPGVRTASLGTVSRAVVVAVAGSSSVARRGGLDAANSVQSVAVSLMAIRDRDAGMSEGFPKKVSRIERVGAPTRESGPTRVATTRNGMHDEHNR